MSHWAFWLLWAPIYSCFINTFFFFLTGCECEDSTWIQMRCLLIQMQKQNHRWLWQKQWVDEQTLQTLEPFVYNFYILHYKPHWNLTCCWVFIGRPVNINESSIVSPGFCLSKWIFFYVVYFHLKTQSSSPLINHKSQGYSGHKWFL